jgi:hypothetical protein
MTNAAHAAPTRQLARSSLAARFVDDCARLARGVYAAVSSKVDALVRRSSGHDILVVVFSRDRSLQLELLLETYAAFVAKPPRISVLYSVSDDVHRASYANVLERYRDLIEHACEQRNFRDDLLRLLERSSADNLMFLVDDLLFLRPVDGDLLRRWSATRDGILSLRLGENIRSSYNIGIDTLPLPPTLERVERQGVTMLGWIWGSGAGEWYLALSLDAHVLPKRTVERLIRGSKFRAPNSLEAALGRFRFMFKRRRGFAFPTSRVVNLPLNSVKREDYRFPNAGVDVRQMLDDHRSGLRLDASSFPLADHRSCHFPWQPPLAPRERPASVASDSPRENPSEPPEPGGAR